MLSTRFSKPFEAVYSFKWFAESSIESIRWFYYAVAENNIHSLKFIHEYVHYLFYYMLSSRNPQLPVSENYSDFANWRPRLFKFYSYQTYFTFKICFLEVKIKMLSTIIGVLNT